MQSMYISPNYGCEWWKPNLGPYAICTNEHITLELPPILQHNCHLKTNPFMILHNQLWTWLYMWLSPRLKRQLTHGFQFNSCAGDLLSCAATSCVEISNVPGRTQIASHTKTKHKNWALNRCNLYSDMHNICIILCMWNINLWKWVHLSTHLRY
jgi:hypothetical protein